MTRVREKVVTFVAGFAINMPFIKLHINGLTHHDIAARREAFVSTAVGRRMVLRAAPCRESERAVAAYVGADMVGYVARLDLDVAWAAMKGMGTKVLRGEIESAKAYSLVFGCEVDCVDERTTAATALPEGWQYTGPMMPELELWHRLDYLGGEMEMMLAEERVDVEGFMELFEAFCRLAPYDVSSEMMMCRRRLLYRLEDSYEPKLLDAADALEELSQRMGGDHGMAALGRWMKHELPASKEAQAMRSWVVSPTTRTEIMMAAASLPSGLMMEWQTDEVEFARLLYGMHLSRERVHQVLSCLVWLDNNVGPLDTQVLEGGQNRVQAALEALDELVQQLKPIFWGDEAAALEFLRAVRKARPKQITTTVNEWVAAKRISPQSCHRDLWKVLNEAGIYTPSESNWNQQVK